MLPQTMEELESIRNSCKKMVTRRAMLSSAAAMVPIPGTDMLADVGMLMRLIPEINERFGLAEAQLAELDTQRKAAAYGIITAVGSHLIGHAVTRRLILELVKKAAARYMAKGTTKFVPFVGTAAAGAISYGAMKYLGNKHVEDCSRVVTQILERKAEEDKDKPGGQHLAVT